MKRRKKIYLKYNITHLIGCNLHDVINKLNKEENLIFIIRKTKGSNEKFNQNKSTPIVVRVKELKDKKIELVVTYF